MADVTRRCGCRDDQGRQYTPGRPCPELKRNPRHGAWGYRVSAGTIPDPKPGAPGHRKRRYITGAGYDRKKDAEEALDKALRAYKGHGDSFFDQTTVGDYLTGWEARRAPELKPSTANMYGLYLGRHIVPALGEKRLTRLRRADVVAFVEHLKDKTVTGADLRPRKLGTVTVRRIFAVLRSALSDAAKDGLIENNPALGVRLPAEERERVRPWERADALRFLDAVKDHRLSELFQFAIATGLRRGEIVGLRWQDVDLVEGTVTVTVNVTEVNGHPMVGAPKTRAGGRVVPISPAVVDLLAHVKDRTDRERHEWGEAYQDSGRVFTAENGAQLRPSYPSAYMAKTVKRLGLPPAHFHSLRHMFASIQIDMGTELVLLSKMMGHSSIDVTGNIYSHLFDERQRRQMAAVSDWLAAPAETSRAHNVRTSTLSGQKERPAS